MLGPIGSADRKERVGMESQRERWYSCLLLAAARIGVKRQRLYNPPALR